MRKILLFFFAFLVSSSTLAVETSNCTAGSYQKNIGDYGGQCVINTRLESGVPWAHCNGSAITCYDSLVANGYEGGSEPEHSAIVVFDTTVGHVVHGHIGIVDDISGNQIKVRDSNWSTTNDEIVREHWMSSSSGVKGYIYCDGTAPNGSSGGGGGSTNPPPPSNPDVDFDFSDRELENSSGVETSTFYQDEEIEFSLNVENDGTYEFSGDGYVCAFLSDGGSVDDDPSLEDCESVDGDDIAPDEDDDVKLKFDAPHDIDDYNVIACVFESKPDDDDEYDEALQCSSEKDFSVIPTPSANDPPPISSPYNNSLCAAGGLTIYECVMLLTNH